MTPRPSASGRRGGRESCSSPGKDGATSDGARATPSAPATQSSPARRGFMYTGDIDNAWSHGARRGQQGFKCLYCENEYASGGKTRLTDHLAALGKGIGACDRVPKEVRAALRKKRFEKMKEQREAEERAYTIEQELVQEMREGVIDVDSYEDGDQAARAQIAIKRAMRDMELQREVDRNGGTTSGSRTATSCARGGKTAAVGCGKVLSQPRIDHAFDKTKADRIGEAWARFFHANDIPGRKANCYYFRAALLLSMELGVVQPLPKGSDIDGKYLVANRMELEQFVNECRDDWEQFGVTVMCDSWTGPTSMSIINFMVYCNEKMLFHKSVNATGKIQNAEFLYEEIKKVVVDEIGHKVVMQIVTDNGSNYKKACELLIAEYPHIFWQPCAAHTINLMLKDIARFPEVDQVVSSAKRICRFFHNTKRLHEEMRNKVGGELIKPNATRFGTVFIFLQSYFDKKDKFREWMVSADWRNSEWRDEPDYDYVENCLTSSQWWTDLKWVLDAVEPLYTVLRYADQQKNGTVAGFQLRMFNAIHLMEAQLGAKTDEFEKYMNKVLPRVHHLYTDTLIQAAAVLDPEGHYQWKASHAPDAADKLTRVIAQIADSSEEAMIAMKQFMDFRANKGIFSGTMARLAASNMTPSAWWLLYGGDTPILQKYALRIVSQCVSSSGCERNWSTFALIHSKVRNRLSYWKLHDLVTVHYNLRLRIQQREIEREERDLDAISIINDTTLFHHDNPIMDWLNNSMSESSPILDENGSPSQFVIEEIRRQSIKRKLGRVGRKGRRKTKKLSVLAKNRSLGKGKNVMQTEDDSEEEDDFAESDNDDGEHDVELDDNSLDDADDVGNEEENEDEEMCPHEETRASEKDRGDVQQEDENRVPRRVSKRGNVPRKDPNSHYY